MLQKLLEKSQKEKLAIGLFMAVEQKNTSVYFIIELNFIVLKFSKKPEIS